MSMRRFSWTGSLLVGLLLACGGAPDERLISTARSMGVSAQGVSAQGVSAQGVSAQGVSAQGAGFYAQAAFYGGATLNGEPLTNVRIIEGDIYADLGKAAIPTGYSPYPCKGTQYGQYRNCGWDVRDVGVCKPGTVVYVGAGSQCKLGASKGNTMLRVCDGEKSCDYGGRYYTGILDQDDNSCDGVSTPRAAFKCPASGTFTVMTASYDSSLGYYAYPVAAGEAVEYPYGKTLHGPDLKGAEFYGTEYLADGTVGKSLHYRVAGVQAEHAALPPGYSYWPGTTYLYQMELYSQADEAWFPMCDKNPLYSGEQVAIPLTDRWNHTGAKVITSKEFTFACTAGVLAKCYRWGYRPWLSSSLSGAHQACSRMARADYCGDGTSWTRDGTTINHWDDLGPQINFWEPAAEYNEGFGFSFEAAWDVDGARCLSHERWYNLPAGFAKDRCPDKLRHPEWPTYYFGDQKWGPTVCDKQSEATAEWPSTVHFNKSQCNGSTTGCAMP